MGGAKLFFIIAMIFICIKFIVTFLKPKFIFLKKTFYFLFAFGHQENPMDEYFWKGLKPTKLLKLVSS